MTTGTPGAQPVEAALHGRLHPGLRVAAGGLPPGEGLHVARVVAALPGAGWAGDAADQAAGDVGVQRGGFHAQLLAGLRSLHADLTAEFDAGRQTAVEWEEIAERALKLGAGSPVVRSGV